MGSRKQAQRGQFNDGFNAIFEKNGENDDVARHRFDQTGADAHGAVGGKIGNEHPTLLDCTLTDEALTEIQTTQVAVLSIPGECRKQDHASGIVPFHLIDDPLLSAH